MIKYFKKNNDERGFSLVEMLVAVFIFSISVVTVMAVLSHGLSGTDGAKKKMIATYLAQEGIEYFRNIRDTYVLIDDTTGWATFRNRLENAGCLSGCSFNDTNMFISGPLTGVNFNGCSGSTCDLFYYEYGGKYGYEGAPNKSGFSRKITIKVVDPLREIYVLSEVAWNGGAGGSTISLSENLFNWTNQ